MSYTLLPSPSLLLCRRFGRIGLYAKMMVFGPFFQTGRCFGHLNFRPKSWSRVIVVGRLAQRYFKEAVPIRGFRVEEPMCSFAQFQ